MKTPPRERSYAGLIASPGLATGVIRLSLPPAPHVAGTRPAEEEEQALRDAVAAVRARLNDLAGASGPMAGELLTGQITLLDDPALLTTATAATAGGTSAMIAWRAAVHAQITRYRDSDTAYLRARVTDLLDLRDRVAEILGGHAAVRSRPMDDSDGAILVAEDLAPSRFLETDWSVYRGAALTRGGGGSHVAMLARSRGIPLLVGLDGDLSAMAEGAVAILDAEDGRLIQAPAPATVAGYRERLARARHFAAEVTTGTIDTPAITADGVHVQVCLNVDDTAILERIDAAGCDGIGLTRTEFLFAGAAGLPDEAAQVRAYVRLLAWAGGKPVTVRTLDGGGDKPIAGLSPNGEANPFLGVRGVRLSLARPEVFRVQLRALARAATCGPLRVMLPMVTVPAEMNRARELFEAAVRDLTREGVEARMPHLGMMVEVPAAALTIAAFDADFYAIGSNDLVQFTMAASRDNAAVVDLYDPLHPAVVELISRVVTHAAATGRHVSLCGDMATAPDCLAALLTTGLRAISVPPAALAATRSAIAGITLGSSA